MKKDYSTYKVNQLLDDDYFVLSEQHPTPESQRFWNEQQLRFPQLVREIELARKTINAFKKAPEERLSDKEVDVLWTRIKLANNSHVRRKVRSIWVRWSVAACMAAIIGGGWMANWYQSKSDSFMSVIASLPEPDKTVTDVQLILSEDKEVVIGAKSSHILYDKGGQIRVETEKMTEVMEENGLVSYNQLIVPMGKSSSVTFEDGTKVWVNAGTRVVYPATFAKKHREIYVEGEIYLEVAPDKSRPFTVKTDDMQVRVLGTKFNVTSYAGDAQKRVVLLSGKVEVKTKKDEVTLKPNQLLSYENTRTQVINVDASKYISWKDGLYQYYHERLDNVLKNLSRYYGKEIVCGEGVAALTCTGKLDLKSELSEVLDILKSAASIEVYETDEKVYISVHP